MPLGQHLVRTSPEAQGIPASAILAFLDAAEHQACGLHSLMLLRHGVVIAEGWWSPYGPDDLHMLYSLSKSFTSTAVGLAIAEGRLSLDDSVRSFFPEDAPAVVSEHLAEMRVRHLLSMSTGHVEDSLGRAARAAGSNWTQTCLAQPVEYAPGTHFVYNSGASYLLSAIVQKVTGLRLVVYLQPRLFEPLGIENASWESSPEGIDIGGWGLSIKTADIARFGQLYLQKGRWNGHQVVPESWVEEATACHVPNGTAPDSDWQQGYGYQFWRCRHGAYRGDGAFGQFCVVMPEQDAVVATTAGTGDMQAVLNLVWEHLLPAMDGAPLRPDPAEHTALTHRLMHLTLPLPQGAGRSPVAAEVSGKLFVLDANDQQLESIVCTFDEDQSVFTIQDDRGKHQVVAGHGRWHKGTTTLEQAGPRRVAASGAWSDSQTYVLQLCFYETPFIRTIVCQFDGDRLMVDSRLNVSFGPTEGPHLEGRMAWSAHADV